MLYCAAGALSQVLLVAIIAQLFPLSELTKLLVTYYPHSTSGPDSSPQMLNSKYTDINMVFSSGRDIYLCCF